MLNPIFFLRKVPMEMGFAMIRPCQGTAHGAIPPAAAKALPATALVPNSQQALQHHMEVS